MESVSQAWIDNQKETFVSESDVEITLTVTDPEAQADATASDNGSVYLSDTESIVDQKSIEAKKYATLEKQFWRLDGTYMIAPDTKPDESNGFISSVLSNSTGAFDPKPVITVTFSKVFTQLLQGITITWGEVYENEYATDFTIQAYNGGSLVAEKNVTKNTDVSSVVEIDLQNYNKIVVTVNAWNFPYHRARVEKMLIGIEHTYTKADLKSFSYSGYVDLLSASLPKAEIQMEVFNLDGLYDPSNPKGLGRYLMERQSITVRYGYDLNGQKEWIPAGRYYMSEWETPRNGITASFKARDLQEWMGDKFTGSASGSLYDIAESALEQADLPVLENGEVSWFLDDSLKSIDAPSGVDLKENTIAEVLQMVANAGCCVMYQDRNGIFRIEPFDDTPAQDYEITGNNSYAYPETSLSKQLKAININDGAYVETVGPVGEVQTVSNSLIDKSRASVVAKWIKSILLHRQSVSGEFRIDPRLDCLDVIPVDTPFATVNTAIHTIEITFNGAFRAKYEGLVLENTPGSGEM